MNARSTMTGASPCACGSGANLDSCCLPYIDGGLRAASAQALMRSRYTAYTLGRSDYLLNTWHPDTRPARLPIDAAVRWLGLKIRSASGGQPGDREGSVEFVARFKIDSRADRIHEISRFVFEAGGWLYLDGDVRHQPRMRPGR